MDDSKYAFNLPIVLQDKREKQVEDQMDYKSSKALCSTKMFEANSQDTFVKLLKNRNTGSKQKHFANINICHLVLLLM